MYPRTVYGSANALGDAEGTEERAGALRGYCPLIQSPAQQAEPKRRTACGSSHSHGGLMGNALRFLCRFYSRSAWPDLSPA
jgi:hypothetical protein